MENLIQFIRKIDSNVTVRVWRLKKEDRQRRVEYRSIQIDFVMRSDEFFVRNNEKISIWSVGYDKILKKKSISLRMFYLSSFLELLIKLVTTKWF